MIVPTATGTGKADTNRKATTRTNLGRGRWFPGHDEFRACLFYARVDNVVRRMGVGVAISGWSPWSVQPHAPEQFLKTRIGTIAVKNRVDRRDTPSRQHDRPMRPRAT